MIAALYVETDGAYFGLDGVEPWDEAKDARRYNGLLPVVAHPPCQRWGKFWAGQPLWIARTGERKKKGDDGGCFAAALESVRRVGGVLEHPWGSHAWPHFGLAVPPRSGGWIKADDCGGWTCCVEQGRYGHYARKPTLLYAVGVELPELRWGKSDPVFPQWAIDKYGIEKCKRAGELAFKGGGTNSTPRIHTPPEFRDLLLAIARSANLDGVKMKRGYVIEHVVLMPMRIKTQLDGDKMIAVMPGWQLPASGFIVEGDSIDDALEKLEHRMHQYWGSNAEITGRTLAQNEADGA